MKADRLLATLLLLQARGRLTAGELARELEVTPRTVRRDIDALGAAGVPVYADRGRNGGYALLDAWRTDATGMTPDEVRALFLFAGGGAAADLGLEDALSGALRKLSASLPGPMTPRSGTSVIVEGSTWSTTEPPAELAAVHAAVESGRRVRLTYRSAGAVEATDRIVDPIGLVAKAGRWYLVAGLVGGGERLFRADRILRVAVIPEAAVRPPGMGLKATWERLRDAVPGDSGSVHVVVRVERSSLATLERLAARAVVAVEADPAGGTEADGADAIPAGAGDGSAQGTAIVRLRYPGVDAARGSLLGFGAAVEVLEPPEVHAALVEAARAVLDQYGAG